MTPAEFEEFVTSELTPRGMQVLDHRGLGYEPSGSTTKVSGVLHIAPDCVPRDAKTRIQPGREGWLSLSFFPPADNCLFKGQLGARSEWEDPDTSTGRDNPEVIAFFATVAGWLRRRLPLGTVMSSRGKSRVVRTVHCSLGARDWANQGGRLCQAGVVNSEFHPAETRPLTSKPSGPKRK